MESARRPSEAGKSGDFRRGASPCFQRVGVSGGARRDAKSEVDDLDFPAGAGAGRFTKVRRCVPHGARGEVTLASFGVNVAAGAAADAPREPATRPGRTGSSRAVSRGRRSRAPARSVDRRTGSSCGSAGTPAVQSCSRIARRAAARRTHMSKSCPRRSDSSNSPAATSASRLTITDDVSTVQRWVRRASRVGAAGGWRRIHEKHAAERSVTHQPAVGVDQDPIRDPRSAGRSGGRAAEDTTNRQHRGRRSTRCPRAGCPDCGRRPAPAFSCRSSLTLRLERRDRLSNRPAVGRAVIDHDDLIRRLSLRENGCEAIAEVVRPVNRDHDGDAGRRTLHEISRRVSNANCWPPTSAFTCASSRGRRRPHRRTGFVGKRAAKLPATATEISATICGVMSGTHSPGGVVLRSLPKVCSEQPRWHHPRCSFSIRAVAHPGEEGAHQNHGHQHERAGPSLAMPVLVGAVA